MRIVIGLTGSIASGKSTVSLYLKQKGAVIIDADKIAKEIVNPGKIAYKEIVERFGKDILKSDGSINRKKLGKIVFSNAEKLKQLNNIMHPRIVETIKQKIKKACAHHPPNTLIVLDAPLLIETGLHKIVNEVWVVYVDAETQIQRLMKRERGLNRQDAIDRIKSQMSTEEKIKYADRIIYNNESIAKTKKQIDEILKQIQFNKPGG